ncbi:hypothetical protein GYH30_054710 [Glycine max]|nr:hypothetical protein GYH30_054710 [Glycine max]
MPPTKTAMAGTVPLEDSGGAGGGHSDPAAVGRFLGRTLRHWSLQGRHDQATGRRLLGLVRGKPLCDSVTALPSLAWTSPTSSRSCVTTLPLLTWFPSASTSLASATPSPWAPVACVTTSSPGTSLPTTSRPSWQRSGTMVTFPSLAVTKMYHPRYPDPLFFALHVFDVLLCCV